MSRLLDNFATRDVLTVTRLDRLARSTTDLLHIAERLKEIGAGLRSLAEPWADTTSPAGRMVLTIFAGIADFERFLIGERPVVSDLLTPTPTSATGLLTPSPRLSRLCWPGHNIVVGCGS